MIYMGSRETHFLSGFGRGRNGYIRKFLVFFSAGVSVWVWIPQIIPIEPALMVGKLTTPLRRWRTFFTRHRGERVHVVTYASVNKFLAFCEKTKKPT